MNEISEANLGQNSNSDSKVVFNAIENTQELQPEYYSLILLQRAGKTNDGEFNVSATGSTYPDLTLMELEERLKNAIWESYEHSEIIEDCKAFKAKIPGRYGLIELNALPDDANVKIDDSKQTGFASIVIEGIRGRYVDFTVLIIGLDEISGKNIVRTFHPGEPVRASNLRIGKRHGEIISVKEAKSLGFDLAKVRFSHKPDTSA